MPKTGSILGEKLWRQHYGELFALLSEGQDIRATEVAKQLDRMEGSTGRNRLPDWSHYVKGNRIPSPPQLAQLAKALRIPEPVLRLTSGYVDEVLQCCCTVANAGKISDWPYEVSPRRAAFGLLFSLFPSAGMHIDNRFTLLGLMVGSVLRLNLDRDVGLRSGEEWNATWLYPEVFKPEHLIEDKFSPDMTYERIDKETGSFVNLGYDESTYIPNVTISAEAQIDAASPIAATILAVSAIPIPKACSLFEAHHVLHAKTIPLSMRLNHAADYVHLWANELDTSTANELREHLQQWSSRSLTTEAVRWIRGEIEMRPDDIWL